MNTLLITGANRGIGLALTKQYFEAGWKIMATCRSPENAIELSQLAATSNQKISIHPLDINNPLQIDNLKAVIGNDPIDILFNNAGLYGQLHDEFGQTNHDLWLETFKTNTLGPMKMMETFVDNVAQSQCKIIANMSSKMGSMEDNGSGGCYGYRATKAALNAICKSAAIDLKTKGITVLILHPGWVLTDMGGSNAEITPSECANQLMKIIDQTTINNSGQFIDIDNSIIPW